MNTYGKARQLIDERNEAISQARFWRSCTIVLGTAGVVGNITLFGSWAGWW